MKIKLASIYIIEIGECYYVGLSKDTYSRWQNHYTLLKMNKHHSPELQSKFNEVGVTGMTFRVLEYISLSEWKKTSGMKGKEADKQFGRYLLGREKWWMSQYSINFCLNKDKKSFG